MTTELMFRKEDTSQAQNLNSRGLKPRPASVRVLRCFQGLGLRGLGLRFRLDVDPLMSKRPSPKGSNTRIPTRTPFQVMGFANQGSNTSDLNDSFFADKRAWASYRPEVLILRIGFWCRSCYNYDKDP